MKLEDILSGEAKGLAPLNQAAKKSDPEVLEALLKEAAKTEPLTSAAKSLEQPQPAGIKVMKPISFKKAGG